MKKRYLVLMVFGVLIILFLIGLYIKTGFLQASKIDQRDIAYWNYSEEGIIEGAKEFILAGNEETCWLLIHGYTSTPDEMKELAFKLNEEFNETIVVPRLKGHGEVPSKILNLTMEDWYNQIELDYEIINLNCEKINVVGFSFGATLATRLAEEKELNNLYIISPYIKARYKWWRIFPLERFIDLFADWTIYSKKLLIAQLNSPESLKKHIAYWNMPFQPVKYSQEFIQKTKQNLGKITEPTLIQQSVNDETSDIKSSKTIYENIDSKTKKLTEFTRSNHVLPEDFDKEEMMNNIINFEKQQRL